MLIGRVLTVLSLVAVLIGCDFAARKRYELVPGGGDLGSLVYRIDQQTGEVCAFRWWPSMKPRYKGDEDQTEGFGIVGCKGKVHEPSQR